MAKIFLSYTSGDSAWAQWLGKELRALGHEPFVHEWEIGPGESIHAWMATRHDEADHVLCVLSDAYLNENAAFSRLERESALWAAASKRPGFALLVPVQLCRMPTLLDHLRCCEPLFGVEEEEARRRFHAYMATRGAPETSLFPGRAVAVSNVRVRVPEHFTGRDDVLDSIDHAFGRAGDRGAVVALYGLRGIGKTTLAAAYAERRRSDYRATWWVRAQSEATLVADLAGLAVRLGFAGVDEVDEAAVHLLADRFRHEGEGILLLFDNAPDAAPVRPYLPRGGGVRAIVTSNSHAWRGIAQPIELGIWSAETGASYLAARTGRDDEPEAALALSEALGGLPLAHEQAAAYCERLDLPLGDYLRRFEAAPAKLLDTHRDSPAEYHDGLTVAKTFALAIDQAARLEPAAEPLIATLARLAPEPVPLALFEVGREQLGEPLAGALDDDGLLEAVAALRGFALVERLSVPDERDPAVTTDCIRLHRLVREVAGARPGAGMQALAHAMLGLFPLDVLSDSRVWPLARRLAPVATQLVADMPEGEDDNALSELMNRLGMFASTRADLSTARALLERSLALREAALGDHRATAAAADNLATLIRLQGDAEGARIPARRALALREQLLPPDHPELGASLSNAALIMREIGYLLTAREMMERALSIFERSQGPDDPTTVRIRGNLALVLLELGDAEASLPLCEAVLRTRRTTLGEDHVETALAHHNLGQALHETGRLAEARSAYDDALAARERLLGADHPDLAQTLNNLAGLDIDQGDLDNALIHYARALDITEASFGSAHPLVGTILVNIAAATRRTGRPGEAVDLLDRAIAILEASVGPTHSATLGAKADLAGDLLMIGEPSRALDLMRPLLEADPPIVATDSLPRIAGLQADALDALGRTEESAELRSRYPHPAEPGAASE